MAEKQSNQDRLKEITASIEDGIKEEVNSVLLENSLIHL